MDSEDAANNQLPVQPGRLQTPFVDSKPVMVPTGSLRHDLRWRNVASSWIHRVVSACLYYQFFQLFKIRASKCEAQISIIFLKDWKFQLGTKHGTLEVKGIFWLCFSGNVFWSKTILQDPLVPVMPFTKPLIPDKLAAAGIAPPSDTSKSSVSARSQPFRGRIGRGGRIVFDRWNPLMHTPVNCGDSLYLSPRQQPSTRFM